MEALYAEADDGEDPELANARALVERHYAAKLAAGKRDQVAGRAGPPRVQPQCHPRRAGGGLTAQKHTVYKGSSMKIAIISLGCPENQVDADVFCHALIKDGHTTVADPAEADIIIINTCGFIESAKAEAIENILMACQYKQQNPDLKVVVTGCLAERYKQQIVQEIPEVDAVVGIGSNAALPAIVRRLCAAGAGQTESYGPKTDMQLGGARVISTPRHYAYLKIAEGCNNRCHYCAIPLIRGPSAQP